MAFQGEPPPAPAGGFSSMAFQGSDVAPGAQPVDIRAQPAQTPAVTTGPATLPIGQSNATSNNPLAAARASIVQELQNNPDVRQRLINSADREVGGDQSPQAWQAYIESTMNRAASRGMSLNDTISSARSQWYGTGKNKYRGYYPDSTISHLNDPVSDSLKAKFDPIIDSVLQGSNVSGFATGNQSPPVTSEHAPITFDPKTGDQFVIEKARADTNWVAGMSREKAHWDAYGQPVAPAVNIMGGYNEPAPRAQPVVPRAQPVNPTAQTDTDSDDATGYTGPHLGGHFAAVNA
jgi:hypothetical protein